MLRRFFYAQLKNFYNFFIKKEKLKKIEKKEKLKK
jgi:hypothetical protein